MQFLLIMHMNPEIWEALTEEERQAVMAGQGEFMKMVKESGEMVITQALADPAASAVVRVRNGVPVVTDGPFAEAKEYLAGYYLVDCESRERAIELAGRIPDAAVEGLGVEVRPVMFSSGVEM